MLAKTNPIVTDTKSDDTFVQAFLLYTGAFLFSIIMTMLVHELGHFLAFHLRGYEFITIRINPFMGNTSTPQKIFPTDFEFIALGGTIFNLSVATLTAAMLRFTKSPYWLPARMYPATAFLTEGMVIITGLFFEETITDFAWLVSLGWHSIIVGTLGTLFIIAGGYLTYEIWILIGIDLKSPRKQLLILNIPYLIYILAGFLTGQAISIDLDFFKRFLAACAVLQWLFLGIRIMLYPTFAPYIQKRTIKTRPRIALGSSIFSFLLGCALWVVSLL
jgi:hypothetical protein